MVVLYGGFVCENAFKRNLHTGFEPARARILTQCPSQGLPAKGTASECGR
eukprot:COSAG03_NODE_23475_length_279_cov_1.411111_1_plen_49_part_01